jgi:hypothetical protein
MRSDGSRQGKNVIYKHVLDLHLATSNDGVVKLLNHWTLVYMQPDSVHRCPSAPSRLA